MMRKDAVLLIPLLLLAACATEPVEKPLVDLTQLRKPSAPQAPVQLEPSNPFKRLYVAPASPAEQPAWLEKLKAARELDRRTMREENFPAAYDHPDLAWTQSSFVQTQMMVHDRYFYDPGIRRYTVDRYLDDLSERFGGIDSVLLWQAYPNIGIDERNQFDFLRDLPGGPAGLRKVVDAFHRRGVRVLLPLNPWDTGTRDEGKKWPEAIARTLHDAGADGFFGDTMVAPGDEFFRAGEKLGHHYAIEPEAGLGDSIEALLWNTMSWAFWKEYRHAPGVDRYRWDEPRFLNHVALREAQSHLDELQYAWFNGAGFLAWENVWGIWNQLVPRDAETLRRMAMIYRALPEFVRSSAWEPHSATLQPVDVFASKWPLQDSGTVWTLVNRGDRAVSGALLEVPEFRGQHFYNLWTGEEIVPQEKLINRAVRHATLSFAIEPHGFGAVIETNEPPRTGSALALLLPKMRERARLVPSLNALSTEWRYAPQRMVANPPTEKYLRAPEGMVRLPGSKRWTFAVSGFEIEDYDGVDVQYPWETHPQLEHEAVRTITPFYLDKMPVTNRQFQKFLADRDFHPADPHNFLRDWPGGKLTAELAEKPVTWVSIEEARLYCRASGKRLPHEWEWQYAAQGEDGRAYPWGNTWDVHAVPVPDHGRKRRPGPDVGSYPAGASPFGILDMQGLIWEWTDEFFDEHTRAAVLKGGSFYQPEGSSWYFPTTLDEGDHPERRGRHQVNQHAKYLLMDPSLDRAGTIGFRCAADAAG